MDAKKPFYDVAYCRIVDQIKALAEPRGKMHVTDERETMRQRLQGAFDLLMLQLEQCPLPESDEERNRLYAKLIGLAESVGRFLGARERETLEHRAACVKRRDRVSSEVILR